MTTKKLIAKVLELDPLDKPNATEWKVGDLALAAPILARRLQDSLKDNEILRKQLAKAIEQRNEMYQVEFGESSDWEKDANAELDRIAKGGE